VLKIDFRCDDESIFQEAAGRFLFYTRPEKKLSGVKTSSEKS
jgi:hypothetical protein